MPNSKGLLLSLLLLLTGLVQLGCGGGGGGGSNQGSLAAPVIAYSPIPIFTMGTAIQTIIPTSTGGAVASWAVAPALPTGLIFNTSSGEITGTPMVASSAATYTVTATNATGSGIATLSITVRAPVAPSITTQPEATQTVAVGSSVSFTVVATGTPTLTYQWKKGVTAIPGATLATYTIASPVVGDAGIYTVTVSNGVAPAATSNDAVLIVTSALAVPVVAYSPAYAFTVGIAIPAIIPTNTGGAVATWSISPGLHPDLIFNTSTGEITGTPTAVSSATYTVTATNATGSSTPTFSITVNATLPPSGLAIPAGHPRLLFSSPALLTQARQWFSTTYGVGGFTPDSHIDYAFSYLMTGNTAHAQVAITWLMAIPHPGQDQMRWDGENAILVFDWCYDQLTPSQKATALANWTSYTLEANSWSWGGPAMPGNNYYWGYLRNSLLWGITSHGENVQADSLLNDAIVTRYRGTFLPFAASTLQGGVPAEGSQYGHYQLAYPITPFFTAGTLGVPLYNETPWYKEAVMYLVYAATNAPTPSHGANPSTYHLWPYSDDQQWTTGSSLVHSDFGDFLQVAATRWPSGVGRYARHLLTLAGIPRRPYLQALDTRLPNDDLDFSGLSLDYWAPGIKFLYARTGWDAQATSMMLQLAQVPGEGHQHQDYGSFQMWRAGQWMTRETVTYEDAVPGWQGVGQENGSKGHTHNVILFEGIGTNSNFYVGNDNYGDGPAQVSRMGRGPDFAYAVTDLGKAYRSHLSNYIEDGTTRLRDDNAHVKGLVREFLWVRPLSTLVVFDRMESMAFDRQDAEAASGVTITPRVTDAALVRKTFLLHSEAPLSASPLPAAPTFSSYMATAGNSVLRCTTILPAIPTTQVINEGTVLRAELAQYRLEVTTSGTAQNYFLHVIQARDAAASDVTPILTEDATTYTLTLTRGTATARLVFQKGMASIGGTFGYAATGSPTLAPLPTTVQSITVTDNGPVWGQ